MTEPGGRARVTAPLSVAQEALWYLSLLVPQQTSYNEAISIRKDGPLDVGVLRHSFNQIVARHAAWRSTFDVDAGEPVQVIHEPEDFELPVIDLSELSPDEAEHQAVQLVTTASKVPYDLRRGPLVRPRLVRFPGEHHRLYLAMHHLVFDGVSVYRVVLPELVALYNAFVAGEESPLGPPETDYADYARFEQEWITSSRARKRLQRWRDHLDGAPPLPLPLDHPRPATPRYTGGVAPLSIPAPTVARLRQAGRAGGATLFQVLATAWAVLLSRLSGQDDVVFSTAADLRQRPEFESVVGYSLTPLVLRLDVGGARSFQELVVRLRNDLLDGLDTLVPFERIVRELGTDGEGGNPVYQTMVILEPPAIAPDPAWSVHQMESEIGGAVGHCKLDLELGLDERPEGHIEGRLIYDADLFDPSSAARMVEHWVRILEAVAKDPAVDPAVLLAISEVEAREVVRWNATATIRPDVHVHELVEAHARRRPDAPAVRGPDGALTYRELCARGRDTARRLAAAGVGDGDVVAFCTEPAAAMVADVLGALMAGAAYALMDPTLPAPVLEAMVEEAGAAVVYADPSLGSSLSGATAPLRDPGGGAEGDGDALPEGRDGLFCLQYRVVGGQPSGVELAERAVVNLLRSVGAEVGLGSADTVLVLRPTVFDAGVLDLWLGLSVGASVVLAPPGVSDGAAVWRLLSAERVSFLHASPERWRDLVDTGLRPTRGLAALCGGGPPDTDLAAELLERCRVVFSAFGLPETTLFATLGRLEADRPVSVGRPLANTRVAVVDRSGLAVPPGVVGELVVAGLGVAGARELRGAAEDAFVDDPAGPGVARVTGRRARWRSDGVLELVAPSSRAPVVAHR